MPVTMFDWKKTRGYTNKYSELKAPFDTLTIAKNIDIDNGGLPDSREGSTIAVAGDFDTLWNTYDQQNMYGMLNGSLCQIYPDLGTYTVLMSRLAIKVPMYFEEVPLSIWFSNGITIGYIVDGVASTLPYTERDYKIPTPAGHILCFYHNRMYVAVDNAIYYTDPADILHVDRRAPLLLFPQRVTMIRAVSDGIYVSSDKLYFLAGNDVTTFTVNPVSEATVIEGASAYVPASQLVTYQPMTGKAVVALTDKGFLALHNGGYVVPMTEDLYRPDTTYRRGSMVYKDIMDLSQCVVTLEK